MRGMMHAMNAMAGERHTVVHLSFCGRRSSENSFTLHVRVVVVYLDWIIIAAPHMQYRHSCGEMHMHDSQYTDVCILMKREGRQ